MSGLSASILEEALAENEQLRLELNELRKKLKKSSNVEELGIETVTALSSITNLGMEGKKLKISGIMLAEGVWNGLPYVKSEIKKMYERYKDKLSKLPITVEHERTEEFKDKEVGKTVKVEWDDMLGAIKFEAYITDPKAIEKIEDGTFPATSMKLQVKRVNMDGKEIGVDYEPINYSLTSMPACKTCLIVSKESLSSNSSPKDTCYFTIIPIEKDNKDGDKAREEVENMSETKAESADPSIEAEGEEKEYFELSEPMIALLPEDKIDESEAEEVELEFVPVSELAQVLKRKRVIYEYYPPGKYPVARRTVRRVRGYYYYYPYYPYPIYYGYPALNKEFPDLTKEQLEELVKQGKAQKKLAEDGSYYYYIYPGYYVPAYYYSPYYGYPEGVGPRSEKERLIAHFGKEKAEKLLELIGDLAYKLLPPRGTGARMVQSKEEPEEEPELDEADLEEISVLADYKIVKNKKTGKYIVMKASEKGLWKIVKQFDTEKEAKDYVANLNLDSIVDGLIKKLSERLREKEMGKAEKEEEAKEEAKLEKQAEANPECSPSNTQEQEGKVETEAPKAEEKAEPKEETKQETPKEEPKEAKEEPKEEKKEESKDQPAEEKVEEKKEEERKEEKEAPAVEEPKVEEPQKAEAPKPSPQEIVERITKSKDPFGLIADILIDVYHKQAREKI